MSYPLFDENDFNVFQIDGLEARMTELIAQVRPKLHTYGSLIAPLWAALTGEPMHVHVAKHARRTVNPPNDTWVAWSTNPRGYKALPHLQLGLWESHLFLQLAVIYECPTKVRIGQVLSNSIADLRTQIPDEFRWSIDHMQPQASKHAVLTNDELLKMTQRLMHVKNSELLIGIHVQRDDALLQDAQQWSQKIEDTLRTLAPIYQKIVSA